MTALVVPGPGGVPPNSIPQRLGRQQTTATSLTLGYTNPYTGVTVIVTHIDITATGAEPVQCFAHAEDDIGVRFYWDSQSTGEGNGVSFNWRGLYVLSHLESVYAIITAASSIILGATINGYILPPVVTPTSP